MLHTKLRMMVPVLALALAVLPACRPKTVNSEALTALGNYVREAKSDSRAATSGEGSLWVRHGRRSDLVRDFKARDINDVVTIRVLESTIANASADAKTSKDSSMSAGFPNLFGIENKIKELPNLVDGKSSSSFEGVGSTSRSSNLRTSVTARVVDVLPNGYLVIEGVREVRLNNESQIVTIAGVVRPEDISPANEVLSSDIAQMSVRVHGKGLVSQPINPGWLYKILSGIMPF